MSPFPGVDRLTGRHLELLNIKEIGCVGLSWVDRSTGRHFEKKSIMGKLKQDVSTYAGVEKR